MFNRMTRRIPALLLPALLLSIPAAAQDVPVEGRWRLLVHDDSGRVEALRGELRLADSAGALRGTLRIESDTGAPLPLSAVRRPARDSIELERVIQGPLSLVGGWNGIAWRGTIARGGRVLGRWEAVPLRPDEEYYPASPAFVLHQLILGTPARTVAAPGSWLAAARDRLGPDPAATFAARHAEAAGEAGAPAVPAADIAEHGVAWLLGLRDRAAWRDAHARDLDRLRQRLDPVARRRFDALFEPSTGWITDLHDAAMRAMRRRSARAEWRDVAPGLVAAGLAAPGSEEPALLEAAWRLWSLGESDTAAFRLRLEAVRASVPSGGGIPLLLQAYEQAAAWHLGATALLDSLLAPASGRGPLALEALGTPGAAAAPEVDSVLAADLVRAANWEGESWLRRHGVAGLSRALGRMAPQYGEAASVDLGQGRVALTTPAAEVAGGALGLGSTVAYDPGEAPLLVATRVLMERERARLLAEWRAGSGVSRAEGIRLLPDPERHLGAGLADRSVDLAADGLPFLQAAVALRRAIEAARDPSASAVLGRALVAALAEGLDHASLDLTRTEIVAIGYDWSGVAERPALAREWRRWRSTPPEALPAGRGPVLVPELRFTLDGTNPTVTHIRVLGFQ
jgi:hypothetical protein